MEGAKDGGGGDAILPPSIFDGEDGRERKRSGALSGLEEEEERDRREDFGGIRKCPVYSIHL